MAIHPSAKGKPSPDSGGHADQEPEKGEEDVLSDDRLSRPQHRDEVALN